MISFHVLELSTPNYLFCDSQKTLILNYIYIYKKKKRKERDVVIHGPAGIN
jgi:hypothetical protein